MVKKLLRIVWVGFVLSACHKEPLQNSGNLSNVNLGALSTKVNKVTADQLMNAQPGYIIRTNSNSNAELNTIRERLAKIGAIETGQLLALNMLFVSSSSSDFVADMKGINVKIGSNLKIMAPNVSSEPMLSADNPPSSGNNNALFSYLWGMDAIDAPQAWNAGYRGAGIKVAVLDVGVYLNHPDLAANLLPALGHNFVNWEDLLPNGCALYPECDPNDPGFKLPPPAFSHATHVAGTIAAVDNTIGVVGVAPSAKIIPVKCLSDYYGFGLTSWIASAIVYAADQDVDVINMSLGGYDLKGQGQGSNLVQEGIRAFKDAIQYAYNKGVTVVCAAGNNAIDFDHTGSLIDLPGGSPHAIAISATSPIGFGVDPTTNLDVPTSYTNYGSSFIDFAAPGGDYRLSASYPSGVRIRDLVLSTGFPPAPGFPITSGYYYFAAGTSMATPHVSGVAALIIGKYGHGVLTPAQVKEKIRSGTDDLGKPGKDPWFGMGRVNAYRSVQ